MKKIEATRINKATIRLVKMDEHKALFERITKKLDEDVNEVHQNRKWKHAN